MYECSHEAAGAVCGCGYRHTTLMCSLLQAHNESSLVKEDEIHWGQVLQVCGHVNEASEIFERKKWKRGQIQVELWEAKMALSSDFKTACDHYEEALEYSYVEFGKYHSTTADAHYDFASAYWDQTLLESGEDVKRKYFQIAFEHFKKALDIREALFGMHHTQTVGARTMCIQTLYQLGQDTEAKKLHSEQPTHIQKASV